MALDPRKLLVLQAVVQHDGVQGAAIALRVSPSAISQQLMALEKQAGISLLDRSARKLKLTPAGDSLVAAAEAIGTALDEAESQLSRRQSSIEGTVTVGSLQSLIVSRIAPTLRLVHERHPRVVVQVHEIQDAQIIRQVRSGELDLGLIESRPHSPLPRGLGELPIANDAWHVVVPRIWAKQSLKRLAQKPWIGTFDDARSDAFEALTSALGVRPAVVHRCVEFPSVLALVAAGAGAAIVPQLAIDLFGSDQIRVERVAGLGSRTITVVHRTARHEPTFAVQAVIDVLTN